MNSEDGQLFIKNLAYFVHTHEKALANALHLQHQRNKNGQTESSAAAVTSAASSITLSEALSRPYIPFSRPLKPAKLTLTPHHLFYLLSKFEDLGVNVGPMNVRLEDLQHDAAPSNYMSFLGHAPKSSGRQSDADSLRSMSSMQSIMSGVSTIWSNLSLSNSAAKAEKQMAQHRDDIRYLYSCFTKIPALKLSPDPRARLIAGYEEFPFDTAVPLFAFKNVSALEICDLDFRQFHGWDRLAEQLRSLTVRRGHVDDPLDLLKFVVLDDTEKRRKRSSKTALSSTPSTPGIPWPSGGSLRSRFPEFARTFSAPGSPLNADQRRGSVGSPYSQLLDRGESSDGKKRPLPQMRRRSNSPTRPASSTNGLLNKLNRRGSKYRSSSDSSSSSTRDATPRNGSPDMLALGILPSSKWHFLRHLSLADNGLAMLADDSLAPVANTLQSLDLSENHFSEVPYALASLTHLRALNLSNCMIDSLKSLTHSPLPAITVLNLRSNRLLNLAGIERLMSLERVDLRDNRLHDPTELARLTSMPDIRDIYVLKNPFTHSHRDYRVTVFNLFRSTPGCTDDVQIDSLGPIPSEKKKLVDRAPEAANKPVVRPPPEDDLAPVITDESDPLAPLPASQDQVFEDRRPGHRRSRSDMGPNTSRRRKKHPRRRVLDLVQDDAPTSPSREQYLSDSTTVTPTTPTESDQPVTPGEATPEETSYHTTLSTTFEPHISPVRPTVDTTFMSPTTTPRIRNPSDDDDDDEGNSPVQSSQHLTQPKAFRRKLEVMRGDLGPNWLTALNEDRLADRKSRNRSFSPASRSSTVRAEQTPGRRVSVGGRAAAATATAD